MFRCFWITPIFQLNVLMTDFLFHIYSIYNKISHEPFERKPRAVTCFVKHLVTDKTQSRSLSAVAAQGNSAANITSGCSKATGTQCGATLLAAITVHAHQILEVESSLCDITEGPGSWCLLLVSILELGGIHPPIPNHNQGPIHSYKSQDFNPARYLGPNPPALWAQKPVLTGVK